jgi:hypothetical protein
MDAAAASPAGVTHRIDIEPESSELPQVPCSGLGAVVCHKHQPLTLHKQPAAYKSIYD